MKITGKIDQRVVTYYDIELVINGFHVIFYPAITDFEEMIDELCSHGYRLEYNATDVTIAGLVNTGLVKATNNSERYFATDLLRNNKQKLIDFFHSIQWDKNGNFNKDTNFVSEIDIDGPVEYVFYGSKEEKELIQYLEMSFQAIGLTTEFTSDSNEVIIGGTNISVRYNHKSYTPYEVLEWETKSDYDGNADVGYNVFGEFATPLKAARSAALCWTCSQINDVLGVQQWVDDEELFGKN